MGTTSKIVAGFDTGEVYDALHTDERMGTRAKQVDRMAEALVDLCDLALDDMCDLDVRDDGQFAQERELHEAAFLIKLTQTAMHVALKKWADRRAVDQVDQVEEAKP